MFYSGTNIQNLQRYRCTIPDDCTTYRAPLIPAYQAPPTRLPRAPHQRPHSVILPLSWPLCVRRLCRSSVCVSLNCCVAGNLHLRWHCSGLCAFALLHLRRFCWHCSGLLHLQWHCSGHVQLFTCVDIPGTALAILHFCTCVDFPRHCSGHVQLCTCVDFPGTALAILHFCTCVLCYHCSGHLYFCTCVNFAGTAQAICTFVLA